MATQFTFGKNEKLKSRKLTEQLFKTGKTFSVFPVKVFYLPVNADHIVKAGVGTSSRNFKKAADRNRIKRLLREAYRTQKTPLTTFLEEQHKQVALFFLYTDKTLPEFAMLKHRMQQALERLIKQLHEKSAANT
ncbi:ribonuclease P protein component [Panacibacter sp. DH6]|uniref:Ribonuclease P protein component n=1 Tax=Panacibacter microcysteis TaxID=2793269 RepID=A0A931E6B8_9BACT|nr:ribonuclease P protein component [Panacibacter microcysteis]MBG9376070.1 ribonuclease P protein component [Panacibacter microcysteis]